MKKDGNKIILTFDHVGQGLYAFDTRSPAGFTIAGEDQTFVNAEASILNANQIEITSDQISNLVAVRYAWADNPICNMYSRDGLPMTPFKTDKWDGITYGKNSRN